MKKAFIGVAVILSLLCCSSCAVSKQSSQSSSSQSPKGLNIVGTVTASADLAIDLSTTEKVRDRADVIALGTITSVDKTIYEDQDHIVNTYATIKCAKIFKGKADDTFQFATCGGYISLKDYANHFSAEEITKMGIKDTNDPTAVIKYQVDGKNIIQSGEEYLLFLKREPSGRLYSIGSYQGLLKVSGNSIYQKENSKAASLQDVLNKIK